MFVLVGMTMIYCIHYNKPLMEVTFLVDILNPEYPVINRKHLKEAEITG